MSRTYGWIKDVHDPRDRKFSVPAQIAAAPLPPSIDLRSLCPPVYNQERLGSCTANAIAAALEFDAMKQGQPAVIPSRLFIYYNERVMEGTVDQDAGAQIRDGIKSVATQGVCPESEWPYDISQYAVQPPQSCYTDAAKHLALVYESITQDLDDLRGALAANLPFVFGFDVYARFESEEVAQTGIVPMPRWPQRCIGGHAVMAVGYDDSKEMFLVRNSYGADWGQQGYFEMPYDYVDSDLASDFWQIRTVS
jgi:C1A family cysteine protease